MFNVSGLTTYRNETGALVAATILPANTLTIPLTLVPGVKAGSVYTLNKVSEAIYPRTAGCSFSASGDTTFSQGSITPKAHQVDKSYCPETLYPYYLAAQMSEGTMQEDFTESQYIYDLVTGTILKYNDSKMWLGATASGDLINGWMVQLAADTGRTSTTVYTAVTSSNVDDMVDEMYNKLVSDVPELLMENDLVLAMAPEKFALWTKTLRDANLYAYGQYNDDFTNGVMIPGTNVLVKPVMGLTGSIKAILTSAKNLVVVMDGVSDADQMDVWYSKDNQEIRTVTKWTLGVGYFYADQIVCNF